MHTRLLVALGLVCGSVALSVPLFAAGKGGSNASAGKSEYEDAINEGSLKYVAKDFDAATELFRKATKLQPRNPLAYYVLGEAQVAAGALGDAEATWTQAEQVSDAGPPALKAKILFVIADLRERQGRWEDAKVAWQKYADFAAQTPAAGAFPDSATTRIRDIDTSIRLYASYAVVRKRIREEDGGTLGKMPPAERAAPGEKPADK